MLNRIELKNFGPLADMHWDELGPINLVIGGNGSGKTFLLKALYTAMRTIEAHRRGDELRSAAEILTEKLYWTFQPDKIGDLVTKGADGALYFSLELDTGVFSYSFGKDTAKQISALENKVPPRSSNSVFFPAKEVLSLHQIILKSREQDKLFGFDDTYLDLARALRHSVRRDKDVSDFAKPRQALEDILGGRVEFDKTSGRWQFKKGNQKFAVGVTAEGIKKIAILDTLISNGYIEKNSIIFIDEPEAALHPESASRLLDILAALAERGIQIFMASHSYFIVKKLLLISQEKGISIPVLSSQNNQWRCENLKHGMPDNPIIAESIRLYKEEVALALE